MMKLISAPSKSYPVSSLSGIYLSVLGADGEGDMDTVGEGVAVIGVSEQDDSSESAKKAHKNRQIIFFIACYLQNVFKVFVNIG
jgi:hypothetical protein